MTYRRHLRRIRRRTVVIVNVGDQTIDQCDRVGRIFWAARGTGQKPRRLRRSASAREDLPTATKPSPAPEQPALDLTLDPQTFPRETPARSVPDRVESP